MASAGEFELGGWRVDPSRGVLARDGKEVRLEPKLMSLLLLFAEQPERVVTKDEIVARVWDGRAIGDDTLAALVSRLRTALGETKARRFIETLPKRGYRLLLAPEGASHAPQQQRKGDETGDLIARGIAALRTPLPPFLAQARVYFETAIARDPKRADAHAGLAEAMLVELMTGGSDSSAKLGRTAQSAARAATALDESFAPAWSVLGIATLFADRDFAAASAALSRAIALDPQLASAHGRQAFAFASIGRFAEAERAARRAVDADPLSIFVRTQLLQTLLLERRYPQVIAESKRALALSAQSFELWAAKGWAHALNGEEREAGDAFAESMKLMGIGADAVAQLRNAHAAGGMEAIAAAAADIFEAQRVLFVPRPLDIAMLRAQSGQFDKAFAALDVAVSRDDPVLLLLPWLPYLDRLRNDPRFPACLERVRLVR